MVAAPHSAGTALASAGAAGDGGPPSPRIAACNCAWSSCPSQRETTTVATALPMKLVRLRHSLMKRSTPRMRAMPATGTNHPVILVVQEIFGVHEHIKDVCRRLAKQGHLAIAPEMYHRQGDASKYTFKQNRQLIGEVVAKVPDKQVMSDLDAAVKFAGCNNGDNSKLAITGFC